VETEAEEIEASIDSIDSPCRLLVGRAIPLLCVELEPAFPHVLRMFSLCHWTLRFHSN
jgi:hypothetical protein